MATNQPPADAAPPETEWEKARREHDYLMPVNEDNAQDPEYISARLRKILDDITEVTDRVMPSVAEKFPDADMTAVRDSVVSQHLRADLERFLAELRVHGRDGEAAITRLREVYPDLHWIRTSGNILGVDTRWRGDFDRAVAERCAKELDLFAEAPQPRRESSWRGEYAGFEVRVFGPLLNEEIAR